MRGRKRRALPIVLPVGEVWTAVGKEIEEVVTTRKRKRGIERDKSV